MCRSSFRFEVRVTTPHFEIAGRSETRVFTSTRESRLSSLVPKVFWKASSFLCDASTPVGLVHGSRIRPLIRSAKISSTEETVAWLSLMEDIAVLQQHAPLKEASFVCCTRKTRSWDFMPPEIVRPVASTTLGCLISLVHRMDMVWVELKPDEGIIRASRKGRTISASRVRGLGLVLEYNSNGSSLYGQISLRIPSQDADKVRLAISS